MNFIDGKKIEKVLSKQAKPAVGKIKEIIKKAKTLKGLSLEETAALIQCENAELLNEIFLASRTIKEEIYGNRLVLFAPLYLSNVCANNCLYCGFRVDNRELKRKKLSQEEIKREVKVLLSQGHKRLLLVAGEASEAEDLDYLTSAIKSVYSVEAGGNAIRRVNVNLAPLTIQGFKKIKSVGIGTYQLFQETYHKPTYELMHPSGPKHDYEWRLSAMDRAQKAGIDDVGIGVLFGLYDYKFEVLALLTHAQHLEKECGVGPHTISVPRLRPAQNSPLNKKAPRPVSDAEFKKIVALLRLAVPYTGMILSTREKASFRDEVCALGISQISAGSQTSPGGYDEHKTKAVDPGQFDLEDTRTQLEVVKDVLRQGFLPSFCTACYRAGRTGKDFMDLAKPGEIKNYCIPNCILTFKEYVLDYSDEQLKRESAAVIDKELAKITDLKVKQLTLAKMRQLENGQRDLYF